MRALHPILFSFLLLSFSYLAIGQIDTTKKYDLDGVEIFPEINPADLLMEEAYRHREENGAYHSSTFQYSIYQKMSVFMDESTEKLAEWRSRPLFLSESVSEVYFKQPDHHYEKLVASRTSGVNNPIFNLAFSRFQFQNLYRSDYLEILQVNYLSPLSKNASRHYDFVIVDTLSDATDSIFVISFQPRENAVFKSLKGTIFVTSANYAVSFFEAKPTNSEILFPINVRQVYSKRDNGCWFPDTLVATFDFPQLNLKGLDSISLTGTSIITVKDLQIDIPLKNSLFGIFDIEEQIKSEKSGQELLATYRNDSLTPQELRTYEILDSIGRKLKLNTRINWLPSLMKGCIPLGPIDLDLFSIVNYTYYEGWRFGLGLYTNKRMSKRIALGGYFAYGLKDKDWKWGAKADFELYPRRSLFLKLRFINDIAESGCTQLVSRDGIGVLSGEYYRHWIITKFDKSRILQAKLQMRPDRNFTVSVSASYSHNRTLFSYRYLSLPERMLDDGSFRYANFYLRVGVRFSFNETTMKTTDFTLYTLSKYPSVQLQYECGVKGVFGSDFNYNKINARVYHLQRYKRLGYTEIAANGGWLDRSLPYSLQYVAPAGYQLLGFYGKEQFAAMRPNEFLSDSYVFLFLRHNFGKMLKGRFSPMIVLCQNIGFGWLRHSGHDGIHFNTMEKGYFESGLMIDNLLSIKDLLAVGVGFFYRYGPYALPRQLDNFAFKVSMTVPMAE